MSPWPSAIDTHCVTKNPWQKNIDGTVHEDTHFKDDMWQDLCATFGQRVFMSDHRSSFHTFIWQINYTYIYIHIYIYIPLHLDVYSTKSNFTTVSTEITFDKFITHEYIFMYLRLPVHHIKCVSSTSAIKYAVINSCFINDNKNTCSSQL